MMYNKMYVALIVFFSAAAALAFNQAFAGSGAAQGGRFRFDAIDFPCISCPIAAPLQGASYRGSLVDRRRGLLRTGEWRIRNKRHGSAIGRYPLHMYTRYSLGLGPSMPASYQSFFFS